MNPGRAYSSIAINPEINRLHAGYQSDYKYLTAVQTELFRCYSTFDDVLNKAIEQLNVMESQAREKVWQA
jgi:hypothetical protein